MKSTKFLILGATSAAFAPAVGCSFTNLQAGVLLALITAMGWGAGYLFGREQMIDLYDSWLATDRKKSFNDFRKE